MKLFKTLLSFLLCLALLLTVVACGDDAATSSPSQSSPSSSVLGDDDTVSSDENDSDDTDSDGEDIGDYDKNQGSENNDDLSSPEEEEKIWTGKVDGDDLKGNGTAEFPYLIYKPSQLAWAFSKGREGGYHFQLQRDIYLNDVSKSDWMTSKSNLPWVSSSEFKGSLDGNGFCIYGIWFDPENQQKCAGLIHSFSSGTIKNLGIRKSYIPATQFAGGFAGVVNSGETYFINCFVDETVYVQYTTKGYHGAGGIIGYANGGTKDRVSLTIENCYSKAQVTGLDLKERVNGIIGTAWNCSYVMKNCYSVGLAPYFGKGESTVSLLLKGGAKESDVYKNVYTNSREKTGLEVFTLLSTDKMKGSAAKSNMKFDFSVTFETVNGGFPKLSIFKDINGKDISATPIKDLSVVEKDFKKGSGTATDPYIVTTAEELRKVVTASWDGTYFELGGNIKVNDTSTSMWTVTGEAWEVGSKNFTGFFDGKGYTVSGLCLNQIPEKGEISSADPVALFPKVLNTAVIKNVKLSNSVLSGKSYVGGIVGLVSGGNKTSTEYLKISGCSVDDSVYLSGQTVGGIVAGGGGGVEVSDCIFTGTISKATGDDGWNNRGNGIVGDIWSNNYKIIRCVSPEYPVYRKQFEPSVIQSVYTSADQNGIIRLDLLSMKGQKAKENMPDLDWATLWKTTTGYPTLK